jgi:signal transduction histidine kinase
MKTLENKNATKKELLKEIFLLNQKLNELENLENKHISNEAKIIRLNRLYSVLSKINEAIVRTNNPRKLFEQSCRIAVEDGSFKMAWVGLLNYKTLRVRPIAYWGDEDGYLNRINISAKDIAEGRGPTGSAIREGKCYIVNDLESDPRMEPWRNKAIKRGYRSSGAFPLRVGKEVVGAFTFHSAEPDFFNDNEINLLEMLASDVSFAIEAYSHEVQRKKIEKQLRISQAQLRKLSEHLQTVREEERSHIAHELHDELGQQLTVMKMDLFWLKNRCNENQKWLSEKIDKLIVITDQVIETIRNISTELRPVVLDHFGIKAAIEWQAKKFEEQTGIKCETILPKKKVLLDSQVSITIFRVCQEALTNVYRHAKAKNVKITMQDEKNTLILKIQDDGKGIGKKDISNPNTFGLLGIHERVNSLNGEFKIKSFKDKGTLLIICLPKTRVKPK